MSSQIDDTKPASGSATTASVRSNFTTAISELEDLQGDTFIYGLAADVSGNALTYRLKTSAGVDATSTTGVEITFRNATLATGTKTKRTITTALNDTVPQGATLGFSSSENAYVYIYAVDNSGTVELGISKSSLDDNILHNTVLLDASSDSATVLYSATALSSKPIKLLGRVKIQTGATAGDWSSSPTEISVYHQNSTLIDDLGLDGLSDSVISSPSDGDVIRYNGTNWVNNSNVGNVSVAVHTSSGTYNPPSGVKALQFIAVGAGGGSGGVDGQGSGTSSASGPGSGGGTSIKFTTTIESSYTLTVGSGGSGGASGNNAGSDGGDTTVASTNVNITGSGGKGGAGDLGTAGNSIPDGTVGGAASGGDLNIHGGAANSMGVIGGVSAGSAKGGDSLFGTGGRGRPTNQGAIGTGFGSGGGQSGTVGTTTNRAGADGADGVIIIKEYF